MGKNHQNGKGDSPRNCYSKRFKENYDVINWGRIKVIDEPTDFSKEIPKKFVGDNGKNVE